MSRSLCVLCVLVLACLLGAADANNAAIRATISQAGANYLASTALPLVVSRLSGMKIPEVDGSTSVPLLGTIDYYLKNVVISNVVYSNANVNLANDLIGSVSGVGAHLTMDWEYRQRNWPHIDSSGSADIDVTDSSILIDLVADITAKGDPQLVAKDVQVNFANMDVKVHGSMLSWLYDLIFSIAKNTIKQQASTAIAAQVKQMLNVMVNQLLATLNLEVPVSAVAQVDMQFTAPPSFSGGFAQAWLKGQFENITAPQDAPVPHSPLPTNAPSMMIEADVDQFLFNSGFWFLFHGDMLSHTVTQADIPPEVGLQLTTKTFGALVPAMKAAYPNSNLEWGLVATQQPNAAITPDQGVLMTGSFNMTWLVQATPNATEFKPMFTLGLDMAATVNLAANGTNLTASVGLRSFHMTLLDSALGPFDTTTLTAFFNAIISSSLIPMANQRLKPGFPLPVVEGMSLRSPALTTNAGYFSLVSDVNFVPPPSVLAALDRHVALRQLQKVGVIHLGDSAKAAQGKAYVAIN